MPPAHGRLRLAIRQQTDGHLESASMRLNYSALAPEVTKAMGGVNAALLRNGLDKRLMDLLFLRVSQINGCSYCVDLHARDLRAVGETNDRLDGLAGWRESPYFTDAEKAAVEWAEALTRVEMTHAPDSAYQPLARHYDEKQVANITFAVALINAWNRVAIGFQQGPKPHLGGHA
jgi:AhpD family alkylhydroperoxidase